MFVRPKNGLRVRHPDTRRPLPPEGLEVVESSFWNRRLRDGDVEIVVNPEPEQH